MQRLEISGVVRLIYTSLGVKGLIKKLEHHLVRKVISIPLSARQTQPHYFIQK